MNEQTIQGLWSASATLANHDPLNKQESEALRYLLDQLLGTLVPTPQEVKRYKECKNYLVQCESDTQKDYFEPTVLQYEQKYSLVN